MTRFLSLTRGSCLVAFAALTAAACQPASSPGSSPAGRSGQVISSGEAAIGGAYSLINERGEPVTEQSFIGRPQLIYFGFAYCPDICPTALMQMGAALELIGDDASRVQPILITIDPERDTVEKLALYVTSNRFPQNLTALTGTPQQAKAAQAAYRVVATKVEDPQSPDDYTMDHSSIIYLMDETGKFVTLFTHKSSPEEIAAGLRRVLG